VYGHVNSIAKTNIHKKGEKDNLKTIIYIENLKRKKFEKMIILVPDSAPRCHIDP